MVEILMMSENVATPSLLKIKVFLNKSYDVIFSVHDVTNKILPRDVNYIADVVMWPKLGNSSPTLKEVIITQFYKDLTRKTNFYEGYSWVKSSNLKVAFGMALTFYTSLAKVLKLKVRKFVGLVRTFVEVTREKLVGRFFS